MRLLQRALIVASFVPVAAIASSLALQPELLLAELREELRALRSSSAITAPVGISQPPDVAPLVGLPAEQLREKLGEPDACASRKAERCDPIGQWVYLFYRLPPGWRGGGAELVLHFGSSNACHQAYWRFTR
jgi:hypothetical protein